MGDTAARAMATGGMRRPTTARAAAAPTREGGARAERGRSEGGARAERGRGEGGARAERGRSEGGARACDEGGTANGGAMELCGGVGVARLGADRVAVGFDGGARARTAAEATRDGAGTVPSRGTAQASAAQVARGSRSAQRMARRGAALSPATGSHGYDL